MKSLPLKKKKVDSDSMGRPMHRSPPCWSHSKTTWGVAHADREDQMLRILCEHPMHEGKLTKLGQHGQARIAKMQKCTASD